MSMPGTAQPPALYEVPVKPAAIASGKSSAVFGLGEVLKSLVHHSLAFPSENLTDSAVNAIDAWVRSLIPGSEMSALLTGDERAAKEDVTKRVPPGGIPSVVTGPVLDYQKLAQAILAEQRKLSREEVTSL